MAVDRTDLVQQVLGLRTELYRSLRPAREWLEIDLTTSQLKVLFLLYSAECASMGQLAASLAVTLSTVTGIVDRLVEHQMVVREEDPTRPPSGRLPADARRRSDRRAAESRGQSVGWAKCWIGCRSPNSAAWSTGSNF